MCFVVRMSAEPAFSCQFVLVLRRQSRHRRTSFELKVAARKICRTSLSWKMACCSRFVVSSVQMTCLCSGMWAEAWSSTPPTPEASKQRVKLSLWVYVGRFIACDEDIHRHGAGATVCHHQMHVWLCHHQLHASVPCIYKVTLFFDWVFWASAAVNFAIVLNSMSKCCAGKKTQHLAYFSRNIRIYHIAIRQRAIVKRYISHAPRPTHHQHSINHQLAAVVFWRSIAWHIVSEICHAPCSLTHLTPTRVQFGFLSECSPLLHKH